MPKITDLTNYTTPNVSTDVLPIVDVANDTTKKISVQNLLNPIYTNGTNAGIGTTTLSQKLTVAGNIGIQAEANAFIGTLDNYALSLRTNNVDRVFVDTSGNVGIGTTVPQQKLHILSSTGLRLQSLGATSDDGKKIYFVNSNGTTKAYFGRGDDIQSWTGIVVPGVGWTLEVTDDGKIQNYSSIFPGTGSALQTSYCFYQDASGIRTNGQFYVDGNVGIGKTNPAYQLELSTDSAAKPSTNTWTVTSDERLKTDIQLADLNRCLEIVKSLPLKYYKWRDDIYSPEAVKDRGMLGWIATDVEQVFPKAVDTLPKYSGNVEFDDGVEEYEEQDYTIETVERQDKVIEIRDGVPVQVTKTVTEEKKTLLYDEVNVVDEQGNVVLKEDGAPLTYQVPRMVKKTRPKKSRVEIENCKTVNSDQIIKVLYGAVQLLIQKVEQLEARVA